MIPELRFLFTNAESVFRDLFSREKSLQENKHIKIQHLIIGFAGSIPGKQIRRSRSEAAVMVRDILRAAKGRAPFDDLVARFSDDQVPGITRLANYGVDIPAPDEIGRSRVLARFGDKAFGLAADEVGFVGYDAIESPFGFFVLKRIY